jgi:chromatin assembly factor 1 subunit A
MSAKIKLLARRKAHFESLVGYLNDSTAATLRTTTLTAADKVLDLFEDTNLDRMWRWEVTTLELLPPECIANARKARSARRKVASNYSAILKLIKSLDEAEKMIFDPKLPDVDHTIAKISRDEEKVLKFEREAEKLRLAEEAKTRKLQELEARKRAKEEEAEEKRRQKEDAAEERQRIKEEIARAREDAKRQKELEKEQKESEMKAKAQLKQMILIKQKASFKSFFAAPLKSATGKDREVIHSPEVAPLQDNSVAFDVQVFRSMINNSKSVVAPLFATLSTSAVRSRKRRTKDVYVSVYTTVNPTEEEWDAQPYAEQQTIKIPNKYRFLSFHEDCRPAYHGTWTKRSSSVTGKTPFGKETTVFDYDYDSEAEWEEGDDEIGEDVEDEAKNQEEEEDEEGDAKMYDFNDGFCVADEQLLDHEEEADEETKALYKRKLQANDNQLLQSNRIRIIAPAYGGLPLDVSCKEPSGVVEGFDQTDVIDILRSYEGITLLDVKLCMDAFPQLNWDDGSLLELPTSNANVNKDDYTLAETIALARFVHHSTINSKEKIVEELRNSNPTVFSIRAKATRKLDSIAVKKKHPDTSGLWYWEVRREFLQELGLTDLLVRYVWNPRQIDPAAKHRELSLTTSASMLSTQVKKFEGTFSECADTESADSTKRKTPVSTLRPPRIAENKKKSKRKAKEADILDDALIKKTKGIVKNKESGNAVQTKTAPKDSSLGMKTLMTSFLKMASPNTSKTAGKSALSAEPYHQQPE